MRGHMPRCVPAPGNRFKFVFTDSARAKAAEFDATEFDSFADACRLKRLMFTAPLHDTTPQTAQKSCPELVTPTRRDGIGASENFTAQWISSSSGVPSPRVVIVPH